MPKDHDDEESLETPKKTSRLEERIDDFLLKKRRVFLSSQVNDASATSIIRKLWYLDSLDSNKPILLVIHSPGGSVDAGLAIWDQIKMISAPVYTLVTGLAASMGSVLSLAASEGKRFASPMARIMIHQPMLSGVMHGQATDLDIQAKEIAKTKEQLVAIYTEQTKKDRKLIEKALDRDMWMNAKEALSFGLLDKIVTSYKELALH